jgi:hypothetical protein
MKNTLGAWDWVLIVLVSCLLITLFCLISHPDDSAKNYYAMTAEVVNVSEDRDTVTVEDYNGNLWEFYGAEDWHEKDCASLLMDSKGTDTIKDDEIIKVTFSAWDLKK